LRWNGLRELRVQLILSYTTEEGGIMKRLRDVPDRIVLNASQQNIQPRTPGPVQSNQMRITTLSSKEVLDKIPLTLYTQRAKR